MKKSVIIIAIVVGTACYVYQSQNRPVEKPESPKGASVAKPDKPAVQKKKPFKQSKYFVKPEEVPPYWEDFYERSQMQRLNRVTDQMNSKDVMPPDVYAFFKAELFNRDLWYVTRNNMANTLVNARGTNGMHPDPDLHEAFITMLEDDTEDPVWRDYCIQFLSAHLANSSDPKRVKDVIAKYSEGNELLAGTAMVQMAIQDEDNGMQLDDTFNSKLAEKLENPAVDPATKLSIIGIMGKRKDIEHLPLIRKYAKQDENAGLKRVAIAAIGTIGASPETAGGITHEDKANVQAALKHKNRAVQLAAKGALKRLETTTNPN